jgi:hypothetical protein
MAFFVFELINFFRKEAWKILTDTITTDDEGIIRSCRPILAALNLQQSPMLPRVNRRLNTKPMDKFITPFDLAPYGRNQCFRILGCGKNGRNRLHIWNGTDSVFRDPYGFRNVVETPAMLLGSLVGGSEVNCAVDRGLTPIILSPGNYPRQSARAQSKITNPSDICCWPTSVPRWRHEDQSSESADLQPESDRPNVRHRPELDTDPAQFMDDTVEFMTENFGKYNLNREISA